MLEVVNVELLEVVVIEESVEVNVVCFVDDGFLDEAERRVDLAFVPVAAKMKTNGSSKCILFSILLMKMYDVMRTGA